MDLKMWLPSLMMEFKIQKKERKLLEIIGRLKEKEKIVDHFLDNILSFQSDLTDISLENFASNFSTTKSKSIAEPRDSTINNETVSFSPDLSAQAER